MAQYIDKDALVAEIKSRIRDIEFSLKAGLIKKRDADKKRLLLKSILSLINTLEVKEVDLEKELYDIKRGCGIFKKNDIGEISGNCLDWVAKHFFELGLKAQK